MRDPAGIGILAGDAPAESSAAPDERSLAVEDAGDLASGQGQKCGIPSAHERDAPGDHEGEAGGDGRGAEGGDQRGHLEAGHQNAVEQAAGDTNRQTRRGGQRPGGVPVDEAAGDHRRQAAQAGEGEIELGGDECEGEPDRQDGEEAGVLEHVQQVRRRREVARHEKEKDENRESGEGGAVGRHEAPHRRPVGHVHANVRRGWLAHGPAASTTAGAGTPARRWEDSTTNRWVARNASHNASQRSRMAAFG